MVKPSQIKSAIQDNFASVIQKGPDVEFELNIKSIIDSIVSDLQKVQTDTDLRNAETLIDEVLYILNKSEIDENCDRFKIICKSSKDHKEKYSFEKENKEEQKDTEEPVDLLSDTEKSVEVLDEVLSYLFNKSFTEFLEENSVTTEKENEEEDEEVSSEEAEKNEDEEEKVFKYEDLKNIVYKISENKEVTSEEIGALKGAYSSIENEEVSKNLNLILEKLNSDNELNQEDVETLSKELNSLFNADEGENNEDAIWDNFMKDMENREVPKVGPVRKERGF